MTYSLSIIVPCYNEALRLPASIRTILEHFKNNPRPLEFVFVDDGSTDSTLLVIKGLIGDLIDPQGMIHQTIKLPVNRGKGAAVKAGLLAATQDIVLLCDADLSCPIEEFETFVSYLPDFDIVIGSRRRPESLILKHQPYLRTQMGRVYSALSRFLMQVNVTDFTCGFKLFKSEVGKAIGKKMLVSRWAYDSEILKIASLRGFRIQEVGVRWKNDAATKVRLGSDAFRSFRELLSIVWNSWRGAYAD